MDPAHWYRILMDSSGNPGPEPVVPLSNTTSLLDKFKFKLLWYFAAVTAWQIAASNTAVLKVALTFHTCGSRLSKLLRNPPLQKFQVQNLFQNWRTIPASRWRYCWYCLTVTGHVFVLNLFFSSRKILEYRIMFLAISANVNSLFRIEYVIFMPRCPILECFRNHHTLSLRFLSKLEF